MRLLVFTQAVDKEDPILGFFHSWLNELSGRFDEIRVICLRSGQRSLPDNVKVFPLRIGNRKNRFLTFIKLFFLLWQNRHFAGAIFVHMNKEYVLAGWPIWRFYKKPVYFWYNHRYANGLARLAMRLSNKVFYTSEFSAGAKYANAVLMPVGVDTELFKSVNPIFSRGRTIFSLGRIDPVKNVNTIAQAVLQLYKENYKDFKITIAGSPGWGNEKYAASIREILKPLADKNIVQFIGSVNHEKTAELFNGNKIFINLTPSGSFDKTILEAMACGCLVIAANRAVWPIVGEEGKIVKISYEQAALKIRNSLFIPDSEAKRRSDIARDFVLNNHSLKLLVRRLGEEIDI